MQIHTTDTSPLEWAGDAIAIGLFEGATELTGELAQLDESGIVKELIEEGFEGKPKTTVTTRVGSKRLRKLILVGLGKGGRAEARHGAFRLVRRSPAPRRQKRLKLWASVYRSSTMTPPRQQQPLPKP